MTVGELITLLKKYDKKLPVVVDGYEDGYDDPIISVDYMIPDKNKTGNYWSGRHMEVNPYPEKEGAIQCVAIRRDTSRIK